MRDDGLDVALKYIDGPSYVREQELFILGRLWHSNIVNMLDVIQDDETEPVLVLEYAPVALEYLFDQYRSPFTGAQLKCFVKQIGEGLEYLHHQGVIHR